jgi:hypothetical protein
MRLKRVYKSTLGVAAKYVPLPGRKSVPEITIVDTVADHEESLKIIYKALAKQSKKLQGYIKAAKGKKKKECTNLLNKSKDLRKKVKLTLSDIRIGQAGDEDMKILLRQYNALARRITRKHP